MLLSPGVGLNLSHYVHAVMPDLWSDIIAGKSVPHPVAKGSMPVFVNRKYLQHFADVSGTLFYYF